MAREGLRRAIIWGIDAGGRAVWGGRGGEERQWRDRDRPRRLGDEVDRWGPHGSDVTERRRHCRNAQTQRKDAFG
jgi:hypothetical protein